MPKRLFNNLKRFLIFVLICGFVSIAAGCATSYLEWAGKMANENPARSVKGYQPKPSTVLPRVPR